MLAATYTVTGGSDVLRVEEIETPTPGPGEVRVKLAVAGVNPTDWKARAGATGAPAFDFQVPGQDGAGVIDAVGEGVDGERVGERVWVYFAGWQRRWGTAAQFTVLPAEQAVPLASDASFDLGASLGIPALTAYHCLLVDGPVSGTTVLVAGGAGAVGHAAIELGKWAGARVIATVSSGEKAELARAAGADVVVNYRSADAAEQIRAAAPGGIQRIVEVALGPNLELDLAVAAPRAVIATYAADQPTATVPVRALMTPNLVLRFVLVYTISREALRAAVDGVAQAVAAGALTPLPVHRFALTEVAGAHDAVERGAVGKVVIDLP
jgi:NADPH2:quinone reductase